MKTVPLAGLVWLASLALACGGQLHLAVVEFPELRQAEHLGVALSRVNLAELTDGDPPKSRESALREGKVLFAQSLSVLPGQSFSVATRLGSQRAVVTGAFLKDNLKVAIQIIEGTQTGLRNFQSRHYSGAGKLGNRATLLSLRQNTLKSPRVVRGAATVEKTETTTILAAQYSP